MQLTIFSLVISFAALVIVIELLRRRRLREKYAVIWVIISVGTAILALFPGLLSAGAALVGIQTPSNLLFLVSLVTLFAVSLQLSGEIGQLEDQTRRLAEEIGVLRMRLEAAERAAAQAPRAVSAEDDDPRPGATEA